LWYHVASSRVGGRSPAAAASPSGRITIAPKGGVAMPHKFQVGQTVQLLEGQRYSTTSRVGYKVVRQLPDNGGERSYRIKSAQETFERVVIESQLVKA
jgi:hypothetical protein